MSTTALVVAVLLVVLAALTKFLVDRVGDPGDRSRPDLLDPRGQELRQELGQRLRQEPDPRDEETRHVAARHGAGRRAPARRA